MNIRKTLLAVTGVAFVSLSLTALAVEHSTNERAFMPPKHDDLGPMVPIDARLTMADVYTLTPEKKAEIDKVNEHLKKGETKKALEVLRPIDVQLTLTALFMPLDPTAKAVDQAGKLLADDKYYEANLALKKAEDNWVTDSQSFVDYLEKLPESSKGAAHAAPINPPETASKKSEK